MVVGAAEEVVDVVVVATHYVIEVGGSTVGNETLSIEFKDRIARVFGYREIKLADYRALDYTH